MITVRRASDRGVTKLDWLLSHHSFSFGQYHDPAHSGYRFLRVINDDLVRSEGGFATHPHRDMEILSYVISGTLEHRDTMGNHSKIRKGELQLMSAGKGVQHSEFNPSESETAHFLQIWILPNQKGLPPSYQQKAFPERERKNKLHLVASPNGREHSFVIHQDVEIYLGHLEKEKELSWDLAKGRGIWIQVTRGSLSISGVELKAGDGASIEKDPSFTIQANDDSEFFMFDLA